MTQMIHAGFFLLLFGGMRSVPRAVATGSGFGDVLLSVDPVATALGTDLILDKLDQSLKQLVNRHAPSCEHPRFGNVALEIAPTSPHRHAVTLCCIEYFNRHCSWIN